MFTITEPYFTPLHEFDILFSKSTLYLMDFTIEPLRLSRLSGLDRLSLRDVFYNEWTHRQTILLSVPTERGEIWVPQEVWRLEECS